MIVGLSEVLVEILEVLMAVWCRVWLGSICGLCTQSFKQISRIHLVIFVESCELMILLSCATIFVHRD